MDELSPDERQQFAEIEQSFKHDLDFSITISNLEGDFDKEGSKPTLQAIGLTAGIYGCVTTMVDIATINPDNGNRIEFGYTTAGLVLTALGGLCYYIGRRRK